VAPNTGGIGSTESGAPPAPPALGKVLPPKLSAAMCATNGVLLVVLPNGAGGIVNVGMREAAAAGL
jgi:hypothetical protein